MTKESLKFQKGDRVAFYNSGMRKVGTVMSPYENSNELCVREDNGNTWFHVHQKCCRRLRPKKKQPPRPKLRAWLDLIDQSIHLGGEKPAGVHWKPVKFNAADGTWSIEE